MRVGASLKCGAFRTLILWCWETFRLPTWKLDRFRWNLAYCTSTVVLFIYHSHWV